MLVLEQVTHDTNYHVGIDAESKPNHFVNVAQYGIVFEDSVRICTCCTIFVETWDFFGLLYISDCLAPKIQVNSPKNDSYTRSEQKIENSSEGLNI
jgi:hypothetical protein